MAMARTHKEGRITVLDSDMIVVGLPSDNARRAKAGMLRVSRW